MIFPWCIRAVRNIYYWMYLYREWALTYGIVLIYGWTTKLYVNTAILACKAPYETAHLGHKVLTGDMILRYWYIRWMVRGILPFYNVVLTRLKIRCQSILFAAIDLSASCHDLKQITGYNNTHMNIPVVGQLACLPLDVVTTRSYITWYCIQHCGDSDITLS